MRTIPEVVENIIIVIAVILGIVIIIGLAGFGIYEVFFASKDSWLHLIIGSFALILDIVLYKIISKKQNIDLEQKG